VVREHRSINRLLAVADERMRRPLAGLLAWKIGRGSLAFAGQTRRLVCLERLPTLAGVVTRSGEDDYQAGQ
jgi:streptomycin 6-kinase